MILHIGDRIQVENPTSDEIASHLRHLSPEVPYLRLDADDEQYLQATVHNGNYWVEWRQESAHRYVVATSQEAQAMFAAFLRSDEATFAAAQWRRLTLLNDPHRRLLLYLILSVSAFVLIAVYRVFFAHR